VKCKKKSGEAKKKCLKKAKKHAAEHAAETQPPPPPPPTLTCPSGQKPCDGGCIPSSQCCNNADCRVSGQVCNAARQCACPAALPDICGGACLAPCPVNHARKPNCQCCTWSGYPDGGSFVNCCSQSSLNGSCVATPNGGFCEVDHGCASGNCVHGRCSSCLQSSDSCRTSTTCGSGGKCLKSVDGTTRCGIPLASNPDSCGVCNANDACDQGQFPGRFCAVNTGTTGGNCPCANGQTFCASPA
jgi:hypothetical protein